MCKHNKFNYSRVLVSSTFYFLIALLLYSFFLPFFVWSVPTSPRTELAVALGCTLNRMAGFSVFGVPCLSRQDIRILVFLPWAVDNLEVKILNLENPSVETLVEHSGLQERYQRLVVCYHRKMSPIQEVSKVMDGIEDGQPFELHCRIIVLCSLKLSAEECCCVSTPSL